MQASLVMFKADGTRRDFPLRPGSLVVGRKNSCELRIPLSSVSRQHCEVTLEGEKLILRDLGSSNGTYHNSIRINETQLAAGDEVVVGPVVFTVVIDGVPADIKPVRTMLANGDSHDSGATLLSDQSGGDLADVDVSMAADEAEVAAVGEAEDDDPIAALEAMARNEGGPGKSGGSSGATSSDSSVIEFDFDDLDLDLDDDK